MEQIKLHWNNMEDVKQMYEVMVDTYNEGAVFFLTDLEQVVYKKASAKFDLPDVIVGAANKPGDPADNVLKRKQVIEIHLDSHMYGERVTVMAGPLWSDDETDILGVWALALPQIHPVLGAFDYIAPVITEMMPEGCIMYLADKERYIKKQGSSKFDTAVLNEGDLIKEGDPVTECLRRKKNLSMDVQQEVFGIITQAHCYPLVDDESHETVGVLGLAMPRELSIKLKEMAENLGKGLAEVSAAMQEMAASASEVSCSQGTLHNEIGQVHNDANEINSVLSFIQEIANETKMLGLNAAIEAARAGDAGRGFGVVAEEIRKLSDQSKQTVVQIKKLLDQIDNSVQRTIGLSDATLSNTQQVAAATEEVNASLEEMTTLSQQLDIAAKQL